MLDRPAGPLIPDRFLEQVAEIIGLCCMGVAGFGVERCTCWEPVFDLEQAEPDTSTLSGARVKCCADCAYRKGSPERSDDREDWLLELPETGKTFWCHQGLRRVVEWRHPCGLVLPAGVGDYQPPIVAGTPYKADGSAGEVCAGWLALRLAAIYGPDDEVGVDVVAHVGRHDVHDLELVTGPAVDPVAGTPTRRAHGQRAEIVSVSVEEAEARHGAVTLPAVLA